ncbi:MAG TPA: hypothetical protein PLW65_30120, partial [Pseudomonadota bacterium]|nr:hypothetical protein [Pseudomonadota bacterium]
MSRTAPPRSIRAKVPSGRRFAPLRKSPALLLRADGSPRPGRILGWLEVAVQHPMAVHRRQA